MPEGSREQRQQAWSRLSLPPNEVPRRHLRRGVEQRPRDRDSAEAVGDSVVQLEHEPDPSALESLDQIDLPQGLRSVDASCDQLTDDGGQLALAAGRSDRHAAHVESHVDILGVDPGRASQR